MTTVTGPDPEGAPHDCLRPAGNRRKRRFLQAPYDHWIGGEYVAPVKGQYFENVSPVNGKVFTEIARGTAEDIEAALDAAHAAAPAWGKTSVTERANVLNQIADRIEQNLEMLAVGETWDNGKPIRDTMAADLPLVVDHFRYFAGAIRAGRLAVAARREHRGLPLPGAAGRRRPDHPVELPAVDGDLEARAGYSRQAMRWCSSRPSRLRLRSCC